MQVVEVVPISRGVGKESLSYFTSGETPVGSVIDVPLRGKIAKALVVRSHKVSTSKGELRKQKYSLKKISNPKSRNLFSKEFIAAAQDFSSFSAAPMGSVLYSLIPDILWEVDLPPNKFKKEEDSHEVLAIQSSHTERFGHYKSIIRENVARGRSTLLICPTAAISDYAYKEVKKGIDNYCHLLHSYLKKSELKQSLKGILSSPKPVVVVATPKFISIPRHDWGSFLLEAENSNLYKAQTRPFTDFRVFAEFLAKHLGVRLILGDLYLRTETLWRVKEHEIVEFVPVKTKVSSTPTLINMKDDRRTKNGFKIVSPELEKLIKDSSRTFLFCARKGLHPTTLCGDCGEFVKCERCDAPLVLHTDKKVNFFLCHHCGRMKKSEVKCSKCNSWKLVPLGIGIDFVEKRLREHFEDIKVFKIDGDSTPTYAKAKKVIESFNKSKKAVLIGTEMAVNYIESVDASGIVSMDSFFSVPDFRMNEKIINLVFSISEKTKGKFIIQTRNIGANILKFAKSGNLNEFYKREIHERFIYHFPPFYYLIKIQFSGKKPVIEKEVKRLKEFFKDFNLNVYPSYTQKSRSGSSVNILFKLERGKWPARHAYAGVAGGPNEKLREKILALPPKFSVDVNPDNLL